MTTKTMQAWVWQGEREISPCKVPVPAIGKSQVLVKPLFNGICFTDKHIHMGYLPVTRGLIPGHEFSAEIVKVGSAVKSWKIGDLVSVDPRLYCGTCLLCQAGLATLCKDGGFLGIRGAQGGLAELCAVPDYCLYPLEKCTPLQGACIEAACCGTRAVRSGVSVIGDNVILLGLEDYNLSVAQWLKQKGGNILGIDPCHTRRESALSFGVTEALDPNDRLMSDKIRDCMPLGADVIFVAMEDYVPLSGRYLNMAFKYARVQGSVVVMRTYGSQNSVDIYSQTPWLKELTIRYFGLFFGNEPVRGGKSRGDWQVTLDALSSGAIQAPPAGAERVNFSSIKNAAQISELFNSLPDSTSKLIIEMN